jgi:5'(3')-deoxyribonucleotidase
MKRFIIDMDEVIADTLGEIIKWYIKKYNGEIDFEKMQQGSWLLGFPEQDRIAVREHLNSKGFFRHISVMEDSIDVLRAMNERYEIFIVSAATEFPNSLQDKLEWLLEHFPFFSWKQLVLCGDKKFVAADYMIDDHAKHLEHFKGTAYLYSAVHNLNETKYPRLNNWKEIASVFLV